MRREYELTDEDVELANEIAHEARSLYEAAVQVLAKVGWIQHFATGEWRIELRLGGGLQSSVGISRFALEYMAEHGLEALVSQLERMRCAREAALIEYARLAMPSFIKEGRDYSAQAMELEILHRLMPPGKRQP